MQKSKFLLDRSLGYSYNIMLGSACNWKCPYCIQSENSTKEKQADPNEFCDKLIQHLQDTNRLDKVFAFNFWGGEPLIYYKTLSVLIKRLSEIPTHHPMRVSSNGSLLTDDNYKIFNKYPIRFEVSYHEGQLTDNKWKIALKIENLVVSSLTTHKVLDWEYYHTKWQELYTKFGRWITWCIFPIIDAGNTTKEYALSVSDVDKHFESLYRHLDEIDNVFYVNAYNALLYALSSKGVDKLGEHKCIHSKSIAIDLLGNEYYCHHDFSHSTIIGNLFSKSEVIPIHKEYVHYSKCNGCKAYKICLSGCPRNHNKGVECYYYQKLWDLFQVLKQEKYSLYINQNFLEFI